MFWRKNANIKFKIILQLKKGTIQRLLKMCFFCIVYNFTYHKFASICYTTVRDMFEYF